ncbi:uncharacterized protein LOC103974129 isoform X1 [Musa acuminata AAA Group]|uniref:uncharacterized protein LOC103974129 isoform X1 n=1 Tax=Musa acuminata AAA Group TaxID=214697 RepID=UPI0031D23560
MANAVPILSENPGTSKRKRSHVHPPEPQEQDGGGGGGEASAELRKKKKITDQRGAWANLDLILSLQIKDIPIQRKIEIAFDYVSLIGDGDDQGAEVVGIPRLVSFLIDWIQLHLISFESSKRNAEFCDSCLDYRCWAVLRFCLQKPSVGVSSNLLRAVTRVLHHALLLFDGDSSLLKEESDRLFKHVFECLSLLLLANSRAFYNAGVELWVSCAAEAVSLVRKVFMNDELGSSSGGVLTSLSSLLLEDFVGFLRFHPNPRNVFGAFVDRLLEPLLELLVLLQLRVNEGKCQEAHNLLRIVKEVLSNGVFHPAHINGLLCLKSSNAEEGRRLKGINESYHRHFFRRLEKMIAEKKAVSLGGFGYLLCLFINEVRSKKNASLASKVNNASGRHTEIPEKAEETSKPLFGVFTQFLEPLVLECKRCAELDLSQDKELLEIRLVEGHCMLKSVNETLTSFIDEKIYMPTEDTSEESYFNFLKHIYDIIVYISGKIYLFWLSVLHVDNVRIKRILPLLAKEIFVSVGYFLEIEYKAVGNDLVELWLMIFAYLNVQMPLADTKPCSLLVSGILKLSCQVINIYGELRQVNSPIFALCRAVRLFAVASDAESTGKSVFVASSPLSAEICLKSMTALLMSDSFRLAISNSIKSIPERQANGCILQLNTDITNSLEWIKHGSVRNGIFLGETSTLNSCMLHLGMQAELLGKVLSEIYTIVLDSLMITSTNSVLVGNSVDNLMKSIRPSFSCLVQNPLDGVSSSIHYISGRKLSNHELPEHQNESQSIPISISWFFVFLFRMYTSCRSLYRQSISLMPPNSAKKASEAIGNIFYVCSGIEWRNNWKSLDDGYFSWIVRPSISLLDVIQSLSDVFFSNSSPVYAPLVYVFHAMAIQRLNDLDRMLKAYEFLQEDSQLSQVPLENLDMQKLSKQLNRLIATSRKEAVKVTKFLSGYLPLLASEGKCICSQSFKTGEVKSLPPDEGTLDENSLPSQIWRFLCQNINIWCSHASNKYLKMFLSHLLLYSLPCGGPVREPCIGETLCNKVDMHQIALELISDSALYEQAVLSKHLTSKLCQVLKKSFTFLINHDSTSCKDMYSLSEWSEILTTLIQGPAVDMGGRHALPTSLSASNLVHSDISCTIPSGRQSGLSFHMQLKVCEDLLYLFCKMPGVHVTATSFVDYATYILNLERLVISNLLTSRESLVNGDNLFELWRLFISCRRAMKHLVVASVENAEIPEASYLLTVFNHSTILWLLKTADELVGLPHAFFGEKYFSQMKTMTFSLVDHTSYIFLTVGKQLMSTALQSIINNEKLHMKLPLHYDKTRKDAYNVIDQHIVTSENVEPWKYLELLAEILADQIRNSTVILKDMGHALKEEIDHNILSLNKLSCVISCLQGFLWGLASTSDSIGIDHVTDKQQSQSLRFNHSCLSRLSNYIVLFENFVYSCISIFIVDDGQDSETHPTHNLPYNNSLYRNVLIESASGCSHHHEPFSVGEQGARSKCSACYRIDIKDSSDDEHTKNSSVKKERSSDSHKKWVINAFRAVQNVDLSNLQNLRGSFLQNLLEGESPHLAFMVRQLFLASAAILKLKCTLLFSNSLKPHGNFYYLSSKSMGLLVQTSHIILQGIAEMVGRPNPFTFVWVDGPLKYLEVVGNYISLSDPTLTKDVYAQLLDIHLRVIGKCISLQGKSATLSSHETGSNTKMLQRETHVSVHKKQSLVGEYSINEFKSQLRLSFRKFIGRPVKLQLRTAVQAIERALIGTPQGCHMVYEVRTGNFDGGTVSPNVAGGIDCLDMVLEYVSEQKQVIKENISSLLGCLFNIVLHLQQPKIFYIEKLPYNKTEINPDSGSVVLMCVEVLTTIAGKHSFQMDTCHASQCLQIPMVLFRDFSHLKDSHDCSLSTSIPEAGPFHDVHDSNVDRQFSIDLYTSCCKLLYTTLKHRTRKVEQCVAVLQDSVITLLNCLENFDTNSHSRKGYFTWDVQEAVKCASFLRRIYEEIRQQKDALGRHSIYFLSSYINVYSGYGPFQTGIKREIDEALRPGIYSLIDICTASDIQQLHTVLDESSCRSTLSTLLHDYQLDFQYEGKV